MAYIKSDKDQNWLLPLSIKDMIPKDHICFLVEEFVESLDFSKFDMIYEGAGHPAYHPRIVMKVLVYGMLCSTRSSRKLARACRENFVFMYLVEKVSPDFRTIARFRKNNKEFVSNSFRKTVELASQNELIDLSFISLDGSKIKANASRRSYFGKENLDKIDKAIDKMIDEDIELDELEEQLFGDKEDGLTGKDESDLRKIVKEYNQSRDKKKTEEKIDRAKEELDKNNLKKVSLSDCESRMMQNPRNYTDLSYNTQIIVSKNQIILSNDVCQDASDAHQFIPQVKNVQDNISLRKDTKVGVDCGYSNGNNLKYAEDNNIDLYVPSSAKAQEFNDNKQNLKQDNYEYDEKRNELIFEGERYRYRGLCITKTGRERVVFYSKKLKKPKAIPFFFRERLRMKAKMEKESSREIYNLRKVTVEPVYGNIKENFGFRGFILRGLDRVKTEFNLVCIAHNLQKIWTMRAATGC